MPKKRPSTSSSSSSGTSVNMSTQPSSSKPASINKFEIKTEQLDQEPENALISWREHQLQSRLHRLEALKESRQKLVTELLLRKELVTQHKQQAKITLTHSPNSSELNLPKNILLNLNFGLEDQKKVGTVASTLFPSEETKEKALEELKKEFPILSSYSIMSSHSSVKKPVSNFLDIASSETDAPYPKRRKLKDASDDDQTIDSSLASNKNEKRGDEIISASVDNVEGIELSRETSAASILSSQENLSSTSLYPAPTPPVIRPKVLNDYKSSGYPVLKSKTRKIKMDLELKGYELTLYKSRALACPLVSLLPSAKKIIETKDWLTLREENRQIKMITAIEGLKEKNLWSFKQLKSTPLPERRKGHWDYLLDEMIWMRADFKQERKWKISMAFTIAKAVLEWHAAEDKSALVVKTSILRKRYDNCSNNDILMKDDKFFENEKTHHSDMNLNSNETVAQNTLNHVSISNFDETASYLLSPDTFLYVNLDIKEGDKNLAIPPDAALFDFPCPNEKDIIALAPAVVPISRLMTEKYVGLNLNRWDSSGHLKGTLPRQQDEAYWLGSFKRYDNTPLISPLFGKKDEGTLSEPLQTKRHKYLQEGGLLKKDPSWTAEEDDALFSLANIYQFNWALVSRVLFSLHLNSCLRSDWDCFKRFNVLSGKSFKPQMDLDAFTLPVKSSKVKLFPKSKTELERIKLSRFLSRFELIRKGVRKREGQKPAFPKVPKTQVNLTAHETHLQSQVQAGVDVNGQFLTPLELSSIKDQRDREFRQIQEHHKQTALLAGVARSGAYGPSPRGTNPLPSGVVSYRAVPPGRPGLPSPLGTLPATARPPSKTPSRSVTGFSSSGQAPTLAALPNSGAGPLPSKMQFNAATAAAVTASSMPRGSSSSGGGGTPNLETSMVLDQRASSYRDHVASGIEETTTGGVAQPPQSATQEVRQQIQKDAQTAAAMIALQNAQQAVRSQSKLSGFSFPSASTGALQNQQPQPQKPSSHLYRTNSTFLEPKKSDSASVPDSTESTGSPSRSLRRKKN